MVFYPADDVSDHATHFMGAVVTMPARSVPVGVSKFLIIDGQQRLTTISVLMCAVRDTLGVDQQGARRRIQQFYLTNDGSEGTEFFKLLPTQGEFLVDGQVVNEGASRPQCPWSARTRARWVDHHAGAEFVVLAEVAIDVVHQHQDHDRASGQVPADLQSAVVDQVLRGVGIDREHRHVLSGLADLHRHRDYGARDGVLRGCHPVNLERVLNPWQGRLTLAQRVR